MTDKDKPNEAQAISKQVQPGDSALIQALKNAEPSQPLSIFRSIPPNVWRLFFRDHIAVQGGSIGMLIGKTSKIVDNLILEPILKVSEKIATGDFKFIKNIKERAKRIPENRRCQVPPRFSEPLILEALKTDDDPDLREMFENLLLKAMDKNSVEQAHPAFVRIIQEMAPDEAKLFKHIGENGFIPFLKIVGVPVGKHYPEKFNIFAEHFSPIGESLNFDHLGFIGIYVDNLLRAKLITVSYSETLIPGNYDKLTNHAFVISVEAEIKKTGDYMHILKGFAGTNNFGNAFYKACCVPTDYEKEI